MRARDAWGERKLVAGIQVVVAEKTEETAMQFVGAGLGYDVERRAARTPQLGRLVAPVVLKSLYGVLAQVQAHAARIVVGFSAVNGYAVPSAVAAIMRYICENVGKPGKRKT